MTSDIDPRLDEWFDGTRHERASATTVAALPTGSIIKHVRGGPLYQAAGSPNGNAARWVEIHRRAEGHRYVTVDELTDEHGGPEFLVIYVPPAEVPAPTIGQVLTDDQIRRLPRHSLVGGKGGFQVAQATADPGGYSERIRWSLMNSPNRPTDEELIAMTPVTEWTLLYLGDTGRPRD